MLIRRKSPKRVFFMCSEEVPQYNPAQEFINGLPKWDGKNHVASLFSRLPGLSTEQHGFLAVWIRSVVAHWLQMDALHGNECVPTLIGNQGCGKTTLAIPDGQMVDNEGEIDYGQLYAQVLYELRDQNAPYWFNNLEVQRIQQLNQNFMEEKDIAEILNACIRKPEDGEVVQSMDCKQLLEIIQKEYPLVANTRSTKIHIGLAMKEAGYELTKRGNRPYYKVVLLKAA